MVGNQVDPAFHALEEPGGRYGMAWTVVQVFYQDIFERKPALVMPRVLPKQFDYLFNRIGFF